MKQYKLKMSRDCWSSDRKPKRDKTFNSAERWRAKREIAVELQDPETSQWREKAIKDWYEKAYKLTISLTYTLERLDIGVFPNNDPYRAFYDENDFAEAVLEPPKGWEWHGSKLSKV